MVIYSKQNNSLYKDMPFGKVYTTKPSDLSSISEGEIIFVKEDSVYQKVNGALVDISQITISSGTVGELVIYSGSTNPDPDVFVEAGQQFDTTKFPELYALLGSDTVPDYDGYAFRGTGSNGNINDHDTINVGEMQNARTSYHTHKMTVPNHTHTVSNGTHRHNSYQMTGSEYANYDPGSNLSYTNDYTTSNNVTTGSGTTNYSFQSKTPDWSINDPTTDTTYGTVRTSSSGTISQKNKSFLVLMRGKA